MAGELRPGAVVQYRRVGRAELVARADNDPESGHWQTWHMRFLTGPKSYRQQEPREHIYWVSPDDLVQ